ncbi:hypothetical protein GGF46_001641 [Coemansia sp. RSA 552]|nr:hypothetical protein GGF46_001641 [Coemansia sp. RSA 552]
MFGENANYMQHIDVFTDLGCRSFKDLSPVLTSLSVAIPSIISPDSLALLPTHTLQRITLHEVRSRELNVLLCGIDSGHEHVVYGALRSLKICLRVGPTNASDNEDSRLLQTSPRTLKFPQLEYLYMKGIRQPVPQMLLSALASRGQCMKCLYIDRTIHGSEIFNIQHMQRLRRLHVTTPYIDNAQALLKWAFPVALPELQTIALESQVNVAGRLPRVLLLPSLRRVELCVFIDLVQVWQLVRQLPRLAFLWVMISDAEDQSAEVRLADAEGMVLRDIEGLGSPLHTLHIWSRTALCTESGEPSQIGVEFVTLLASLTSLVSFVCDTSAAGVRNMLCLLLRNHRIASRAAHLGALHIKEYGSL